MISVSRRNCSHDVKLEKTLIIVYVLVRVSFLKHNFYCEKIERSDSKVGLWQTHILNKAIAFTQN